MSEEENTPLICRLKMLEEENTPLVRRLRKRKSVSYTYTSFDSETIIDSPICNYKKPREEVSVSLLNEENELTEYEQIRLQNIEERRRLLCELNIEDVKKEFNSVVAVEKKKVCPRQFKPKTPLPSRPKSLRLQKKNPDGEPVVENKNESPLATIDPVITRKPSGSFPMISEAGNELDGKRVHVFIDNLKSDISMLGSETGRPTKFSIEMEEFQESLEKLMLSPKNIAKVVPHRIYSLAVHPATELLLAAGDKWGNIGLWSVNANEGEDVLLFQPHVGPVNCISFCNYNPAKIYSTSHDGTVRCGDMIGGIFDDVYASDENMQQNHTTWHCQIESNCLLVAHGNGKVAVVDDRCKDRVQGWFNCHARSVRTVQLHPLQNEYFITSSALCEAKIWDRRYMLNRKYTYPVCNLTHAKGLSSAFFSPSGKYVLTTCNDDRLRIYDVTKMNYTRKLITEKRHHIRTGQWLTTMKARWHPQRDDVFIVGSMGHPRCIPVYNSKGKLIHTLMDEHMNSVCSVCLFHPTQQIVFGGNSSGTVYVFM